MKNLIISITLGFLIIFGNLSCSFRMLQSAPEAKVAEKEQLPYTVAILPFANKTANPEAGTIVRKMFYNFFSSLNYRDLEPYVIDENLKANNLYEDITSGKNVSPKNWDNCSGWTPSFMAKLLLWVKFMPWSIRIIRPV